MATWPIAGFDPTRTFCAHLCNSVERHTPRRAHWPPAEKEGCALQVEDGLERALKSRSELDPAGRRLLARMHSAAMLASAGLLIAIEGVVERRQIVDDAHEVDFHAMH